MERKYHYYLHKRKVSLHYKFWHIVQKKIVQKEKLLLMFYFHLSSFH